MLEQPFKYQEHIEELRSAQGLKGAFNRAGKINEGYLFQLTSGQFNILKERFIIQANIQPLLTHISQQTVIDEVFDLQEQEQQYQGIHIGKIKSYTKEELEQQRNKNKIRKKLSNTSDRYETDARLKATRLDISDYQCEVHPDHNVQVFIPTWKFITSSP